MALEGGLLCRGGRVAGTCVAPDAAQVSPERYSGCFAPIVAGEGATRGCMWEDGMGCGQDGMPMIASMAVRSEKSGSL